MKNTKVWAHRGASGYAPENTIEAFQLAVEMNADGIELDVQLTKDGELVVIHDEVIDRVSNGSGWVKDYTLKELKVFNYNKTHIKYNFAEIPTLEEVYSTLKDTDLYINVELKTGIVFYNEIEKKVLELENNMGMSDRVIYSSFNHYSIMKIKELNPKAKTGFLYVDGFTDMVGYGAKMGVNAIHPPVGNIKFQDLGKLCKKNGLQINVWNVRDNDIINCCEIGVDAIITNYPDRTRKIIEEYSRGEFDEKN